MADHQTQDAKANEKVEARLAAEYLDLWEHNASAHALNGPAPKAAQTKRQDDD